MSHGDVYERLRAAIVEGELQPNERLVEATLTESLAASRASVRTALVRLAQEGLVEHERNRGARVRMVDEHEAAEILEARGVLEGLAARHAATEATEADVADLRAILGEMRASLDGGDLLAASDRNADLHRGILRMSGHRTAIRLIDGLNGQIVRYQYRTILVPGRSTRSFEEHTAIVDAIAARDAAGAEEAMRVHLAHVAEALRHHRAGGDAQRRAVGF